MNTRKAKPLVSATIPLAVHCNQILADTSFLTIHCHNNNNKTLRSSSVDPTLGLILNGHPSNLLRITLRGSSVGPTLYLVLNGHHSNLLRTTLRGSSVGPTLDLLLNGHHLNLLRAIEDLSDR